MDKLDELIVFFNSSFASFLRLVLKSFFIFNTFFIVKYLENNF